MHTTVCYTVLAWEIGAADYPTFEAYCKARWEWSRSRAYRMIDCAHVIRSLSPMGDKDQLPSSERQARELLPLKGICMGPGKS